jgi:hypothetical protein
MVRNRPGSLFCFWGSVIAAIHGLQELEWIEQVTYIVGIGFHMTLYDYIYVDLDKVISLYSQLTGGVVELRESNRERTYTSDNKRNYDFKVFKHDAGGTDQDKSGMKEVIKPHHSVLMELEQELTTRGYLIDLNEQSNMQSLQDQELREKLKSTLCVKVCGRAVVEDYERIKSIAHAFPEIANIINKSVESSFRQSPEFVECQRQVEEIQREIKHTKDRNARSAKEQQLRNIRKTVDGLMQCSGKVGDVEPWILDGVKTWIDTFLPGIVNLRIYPSFDYPEEHVFGHMKKGCFEDADSNYFHFTYGSMPTENITMIGIITSVPTETGDSFNPLMEFQKDFLADFESFENAFRGMFRGFDGMEQMIRTCRFPRVLVQPLTVYRSVHPTRPLDTDRG